jgi:hypothetical protein
MKIYLNLLVLFMLLNFSACQRDKEKSFLKGTYTNSAKGEFSVADDTLVVEPAENNNFLIHRRTGFNVINEGQLGKRQYEKEEWDAIYDESTKTLTETRKGKLITIYPDSGCLKVGKRKYIKK